MVVLGAALFIISAQTENADPVVVISVLLAVGFLVHDLPRVMGLSRADEAAQRVREAEARLEAALAEPRTEGTRSGLKLSELWAVTHARLDRYHGIALKQARASFLSAQVAMVTGFAMLVVFTVLGLRSETTAGSVVAGALGVASAGLAGYVSRTFVRSQEAAATHLRSYFDQPLEFSRYLAAERLLNDSDLTRRERAAVVATLAGAMAAGPDAPADAGTAGAALLAVPTPSVAAGRGGAGTPPVTPSADQTPAAVQPTTADGSSQPDADGTTVEAPQ